MTEQPRIDYEQKLIEYEQQQQSKKEASAKIFNPKQLFEDAQQIKTVEDPVLGTVSYGDLTFEDSFEFDTITDRKLRISTIAYLMLKKADPTVTVEQILKMPLKQSNALMAIVAQQPCFL